MKYTVYFLTFCALSSAPGLRDPDTLGNECIYMYATQAYREAHQSSKTIFENEQIISQLDQPSSCPGARKIIFNQTPRIEHQHWLPAKPTIF
jgi:hypothetical protein